tara:strand:+ start:40 stop:309 length:270 start_codon:yes stop_codon:yes gene_type:complete
MFIGSCYSEFPICTSEEMTNTFNGEVVEYNISIDQQLLEDIHVNQKHSDIVYINIGESFTTSIDKQVKYDLGCDTQMSSDIFIDQQLKL